MPIYIEISLHSGKKVSFTDICFGIIERLSKTTLKESKYITYYPTFHHNDTVNLGSINVFLNDMYLLLDKYIVGNINGLQNILRYGITMSTNYPAPFIVGIFEIIRDIFIDNDSPNIYKTIKQNYPNFRDIESIKHCYYIFKMLHSCGPSALSLSKITRGGHNFLDYDIIKNKLKDYKPLKEYGYFKGRVNKLFLHGEKIDAAPYPLLLFNQSINSSEINDSYIFDTRISKHLNRYIYNKDEIQQIIDLIG